MTFENNYKVFLQYSDRVLINAGFLQKEVQNNVFIYFIHVAYFLKQYICESPCNFFALLITFQMMGSKFQSELPFLSYKIFKCSDFTYLKITVFAVSRNNNGLHLQSFVTSGDRINGNDDRKFFYLHTCAPANFK